MVPMLLLAVRLTWLVCRIAFVLSIALLSFVASHFLSVWATRSKNAIKDQFSSRLHIQACPLFYRYVHLQYWRCQILNTPRDDIQHVTPCPDCRKQSALTCGAHLPVVKPNLDTPRNRRRNRHDVVLCHMAVVPRPPIHCAQSSSRPFVTWSSSHPSVVRHRRLVVRYVVVPLSIVLSVHVFVCQWGRGKEL